MTPSDSPDELRRLARERLVRRQTNRLRDVPPEQVVEELRVHQVELELQNDELRRAEADLSASFDAYLELFEFAPVAFITVDAALRVEKVNRAATELFGALPVGSSIVSLVPPQPAPPLGVWLQAARSVPVEREISVVRADGSAGTATLRAVRVTGEHRLLSFRDVTAIREARRALEASERDMRRLVDLSPDAICVTQRGTLVYVNHRFEQMLGGDRGSFRAARLVSFVHADDVSSLGALTEEGETPGARTLRLLTRDGGERVVEVRAMPLRFDGKASVLYTARDLTDRRRMEARIEQAERLATVGMLVAGVAHEVNNPLAFTMGNLEVLVAGLERHGDAALLEAAVDALEGAQRVATIVSDLRTFQRVDDEIRAVEPNRVVVQTLRLAEPEIPKHIRVSRDLGAVPHVLGNESRLGQVLLNLLMNAAQAMERSERPPAERRIRLRTWHAEGDVCIAVEDNGPGIAEDQLTHIFDPFFTTRRGVGGTGLGLAICNSLVQQMGGFIAVDSEVGEGARFVVHLPTGEGAPPEVDPRPAEVGALTEDLTVLVVDDERSVVRSVRRLLRDVSVLEAFSGREAIELLGGPVDVDIVLCDLVMADGGGHDVLQWVEGHRPELARRLVFMTGMAHPDLPLEAAATVLEKPFTGRELRRTLSSVLPPPSAVEAAPEPAS